MPNAYDIAYAIGLGLAAPGWLIRRSSRQKVFRALRERMGQFEAGSDPTGPGVMIHAVSLGEINATRSLVGLLGEKNPSLRFIVSTTTDTGFARGLKLYGSDPKVTVIRYPLDFSSAIRRVLDALQPSVVVLMELEVWPNFIRHCAARGIPVVLVNGRLTASSFRNYRLAKPLVKPTFRRLAAACVQEEAYSARFVELGVPPQRVQVTGTMKFDTAEVQDTAPGADALAADMGLRAEHDRLWVCGSTGPGEEEIVLSVYARLLSDVDPKLRLAIIPRHPQRFDEVATLIQATGFPLLRRSSNAGPSLDVPSTTLNSQTATRDPHLASPHSQLATGNWQPSPPVLLGDTMGELRKFYSLATVVFVGRTLVDLGPRQHGSDMIEPAALGKPVIVGPYTGNFADVMSRFRAAGAMKEVANEEELCQAVKSLFALPAESREMGDKAKEVVRVNKGATARHVEMILAHLKSPQ